MPSFFPGMDPYLEHSSTFPGVHSRMTIYLAGQLAELIRPRYIASVGERVYVQKYDTAAADRGIIPNVSVRHSGGTHEATGGVAVAELDQPTLIEAPEPEITEPFIEIIDRESGMAVVTVIELVSPTNKYAGPGREAYVGKQQEVLHSDTSLVEIDLLRRGPHVMVVPEYLVAGRFDYDYLICVRRARTTGFEVYTRTVRDPLPRIRIPLSPEDPDAGLDLRAALDKAYDAGSYGDRLKYDEPCQPPLSEADQTWADALRQGNAK